MNRNIYTVRRIVFYFMLSFAVIFINCSSDNNEKSSVQGLKANSADKKDACGILSKEDIEKIMDIKIKNFKHTLDNANSDNTRWATQCSFYTEEGNKSVGILIQYDANENNPTNLTDLITSMSVPGDEESSNELSEALKKGTQIKGLGEIAVWYALYDEAPTLLVRYKKHYQVIINTLFFDYDESTMNKAKAIAEKVMAKI